ncbi:MAG: HIT domain-containing protein [Candidatus Omnitrophica bacterium]|nr:HIT domain-containing protein [Candidatus Omnitrophota bacterium]MBU1925075.1 HIT domain-containing protein [Candidatus Omnitrophota bacterium]
MNKLWAPWRIKYITAKKNKRCIFCQKPKEDKDRKNYLIRRKKYAYSMLNIFPYNNGHILVAPYRHIADLEKLTQKELNDMLSLTIESTRKLKSKLKAQGFNVGMNIGKCGGAGFDRHLHIHIVPRWEADTNFMPVLAGTKIISQSLDELYRILKI